MTGIRGAEFGWKVSRRAGGLHTIKPADERTTETHPRQKHVKTAILAALVLCSAAYSQTVTAKQVPGQKFLLTGTITNGTQTTLPNGVIVYNGGVRILDSANKTVATFYATGPNQWTGTFSPKSFGTFTVTDNDASTTVTLANAAPNFSSFSVTAIGQNYLRFSGTVADEAPEGLTITLDGPAGIKGATATAKANGTFSVDLNYSGPSAAVTARVVDWYGLTASRVANIP